MEIDNPFFMKLPLFQIDAFTDQLFAGNPACVVPLKEWLPDDLLLQIARENAVAETAYFVDHGEAIHLRWFTPDLEMDLCGHATLATAHCLITHLGYTQHPLKFHSLSGPLEVSVHDEFYTLNFPLWEPLPEKIPENISKALSIQPKEVYKTRDFLLVYESQSEIEALHIDRLWFDRENLGTGGVIVTAPGQQSDFVSRFLTPGATILEDPVTGSAHCTLTPYWAKRLGKTSLKAMQLSARKGTLLCKIHGERVQIIGQAKTYLEGWINC